MQKIAINCTYEEEFFNVFVSKYLVLVPLFFSLVFYFSSDLRASPLDYPSQATKVADSLKKGTVLNNKVVDWEELEGKPEILKKGVPKYPELAKKEGISGVVLVEVIIDTNGDVEKAEISKSIKGLDQAALDAARAFKFTPGTKSEQPVKVKMKIPFKFHLK
jgi:TonB family protein